MIMHYFDEAKPQEVPRPIDKANSNVTFVYEYFHADALVLEVIPQRISKK